MSPDVIHLIPALAMAAVWAGATKTGSRQDNVVNSATGRLADMDTKIDRLPSPACGRGVGGEGGLLDRAKHLRANQTEAEQRLWYYLRAHRFLGLKFKRQEPIGPYIVDFVCRERGLIVEADGSQHAEQTEYDSRRDAWLKKQGFTVLRFWNHEVMGQSEAVLEQIRQAALSPNPSPASGRGERPRSNPGG